MPRTLFRVDFGPHVVTHQIILNDNGTLQQMSVHDAEPDHIEWTSWYEDTLNDDGLLSEEASIEASKAFSKALDRAVWGDIDDSY